MLRTVRDGHMSSFPDGAAAVMSPVLSKDLAAPLNLRDCLREMQPVVMDSPFNDVVGGGKLCR